MSMLGDYHHYADHTEHPGMTFCGKPYEPAFDLGQLPRRDSIPVCPECDVEWDRRRKGEKR